MDCNVFIEGIPGSGKTTLLGELASRIDGCKAYREGDISPVELAWCSYMRADEYKAALGRFPALAAAIADNSMAENDKMITAYTKIKNAGDDFYRFMELCELYGGRRPADEFESVILSRYRAFHGHGCIFECSFMQNIVDELLLFRLCDTREVTRFYRRLITAADMRCFRLIRLTPRDIDETIGRIRRQRVNDRGEEEWYMAMQSYVAGSPYGKAVGGCTQDILRDYFTLRTACENEIIGLLPDENVLIVDNFDYNIDRIINTFLRI